eukprot:3427006-Amphidinium_carterae.1
MHSPSLAAQNCSCAPYAWGSQHQVTPYPALLRYLYTDCGDFTLDPSNYTWSHSARLQSFEAW